MLTLTRSRCDRLASLASLSPSAPNNQPNSPFRQSNSQALLASPDSDLCSIDNLVLISAPGLHYSDLSLLPPTSSLAALQAAAGDKVSFPYVDGKKSVKGGAVDRFVSRYVAECGARIERSSARAYEHAVWSEVEGKRVRVQVVEGLEEWELTGKVARQNRKQVVEQIDSVISTHLASVEGPFAVILTSLAHLPAPPATKLAKRQLAVDFLSDGASADGGFASEVEDLVSEAVSESEDEYDQIEDFLEGFASSLWDEATAIGSAAAANGTSIFAVKPNSGLLHRYVFFTPGLILGTPPARALQPLHGFGSSRLLWLTRTVLVPSLQRS